MISKFAIACVAAILAGGATAGLATDEPAGQPAQVTESRSGTPLPAIANPNAMFRDVAVQFVSGKTFGHVVAISTDGRGRVSRVRIALADMPSQQIWLDQDDLVYSRSQNVIVAHDVHAPAMAVAEAR